MNSTFEFVRGLWIGAQLGAPAPIQRHVMPRMHAAKELARLLVRPFMPVRILEGENRAGRLRVAYIGLDFARPVLQSILFAQAPAVEEHGRVAFWNCRRLADELPVDLVVISADKHLIRRLPRENAIVLPEHISHRIDARGTWDDVTHRLHRKTRENELRLVRKYGYSFDVSHDDGEFYQFYDEMYLPTMQSRHGELADPMSRIAAYQTFRHGALLRVKREGIWVGGAICQAQLGIMNSRIIGVWKGDAALIREGALAKAPLFVLQYGNQQGCDMVDLLGTEPYIKQGMFQFKRSWGSTLAIPSHLHRRIWLRVQRNTPAVGEFLKETPMVVLDAQERLHGMVFVDDAANASPEMEREWKERYMTPGMDTLIVRSVRYFQRPADMPADDSVIPILAQTGEAQA